MANSRQATFLSGMIENAPTIVFFCALYAIDDLRVAGWITWPIALVICGAYLGKKLQPNTIMIGVNVYFVAAVTVGESLLFFGMQGQAILLAENALYMVLTATLLVGVVLTLISKKGYVGFEFATRKATIKASLVLLLVNFAGVLWAVFLEAERLVEVGIPLLILFGAQHFMIARALDSNSGSSSGQMILAGAVITDDTSVASAA